MKNTGKLLLSILFVFLLFTACSEEEVGIGNNEIESSENLALKAQTNGRIVTHPDPECTLAGADWDGYIMQNKEVKSFSIEAVNGATYSWVTDNKGIRIISGANTPTVTVSASCLGGSSGVLSVSRETPGAPEPLCSNTGVIKVNCSGSEPCLCPNPKISIYDPYPNDPSRNCSYKSNDLYTVTLSGVQSGDVLKWSGNSNVHLQNGQGTTTLAFYIYDTNKDFVINCTVTRKCADGTTFTRTATYGSNISQLCKNYAQYTSGTCGEIDPGM